MKVEKRVFALLYRNIFIRGWLLMKVFEVVELYIAERFEILLKSCIDRRNDDLMLNMYKRIRDTVKEIRLTRFSICISRFLLHLFFLGRKWYYYTRLDFVSGVCSIITTSRNLAAYYRSEYFSRRGGKERKQIASSEELLSTFSNLTFWNYESKFILLKISSYKSLPRIGEKNLINNNNK